MFITNFFESSRPFLHISRSLGNRTIPSQSKEWRSLRQKAIFNYKSTCCFCGTKVNKGIIFDHLDGDGSNNTKENLILNCPGCYMIRHVGRGDVYKMLVFRKSNMDQVDIVKRYYDYYLTHGFTPRPELIDPHCQIIQDHFIKVNDKTVLHVLNRNRNEKSPVAIASLLLDYKHDELDGFGEIKGFFTNRFSFRFLQE